jgi:hypothetical protein
MRRWSQLGIAVWKYASPQARSVGQAAELPSLNSYLSRRISFLSNLRSGASDGRSQVRYAICLCTRSCGPRLCLVIIFNHLQCTQVCGCLLIEASDAILDTLNPGTMPLQHFGVPHTIVLTFGTLLQGDLLRQMNRAGQHASVVQQFESGAVQVREMQKCLLRHCCLCGVHAVSSCQTAVCARCKVIHQTLLRVPFLPAHRRRATCCWP